MRKSKYVMLLKVFHEVLKMFHPLTQQFSSFSVVDCNVESFTVFFFFFFFIGEPHGGTFSIFCLPFPRLWNRLVNTHSHKCFLHKMIKFLWLQNSWRALKLTVLWFMLPIVAKRRKLDHSSDRTPAKSENIPDNAQTVVRLCVCMYIFET